MLDLKHSRLGDTFPDIVAKEEDAVTMSARFGDMEVAAYKRDQEGVEDIVQELVEELFSLASVGL